MTKLNIVLTLALIASSFYLVTTSHDARLHFAEIHRAQTEQARLDLEHKRLEAERQQQATSLNVERKARDRLRMRTANPSTTQYVADSGGTVSSTK